jgi:pimeloyl-ACP methyl ester carboxylesterase
MSLLATLLSLLLAAAPAFAAGTVNLKAEDGRTIVAQASGSGEDCAVLLHGDLRTRKEWEPFAKVLAERGFRVLVPDLRGHGESGGTLDETTYAAMPQDVRAAIGHLTTKPCRKLALVGSELGAVLALQLAAEDARVTNLVLLSPRLSAHGLKITAALAAYGDRPALLVSAKDDGSGARTAAAVEERLTGPKQLIWVEGSAIGPLLLNQLASLEATMLGWLASEGRGEEGQAARGSALGSAGGEDLETTGKRIGEE